MKTLLIIILIENIRTNESRDRNATGSSSEVCFDLSQEVEPKSADTESDNEKKHSESEKLNDDNTKSDLSSSPGKANETKPKCNTEKSASKQNKSRGVDEASMSDLSINDDSSINTTTNSQNCNTISCYLCIKVNKNKDFITCPLNRKMKNRLSSEFWFQINDNR